MTVPVPVGLSTASSWSLADWRKVKQTATASSAGTATIDLPVPDGELWLLDHAVIQSTSSGTPTFRLYDSPSTSAGNLADGSNAGTFAVADWPAGLLFRPGDELVAVWTGATAGATCSLTAQLRVYRQG